MTARSQKFRTMFHAALVAATFMAAPRVSPASSFQVGDLYLLSNALPGIGAGIAHVDAASGAVLGVVELPSSALPGFAYDPFRDRLLYLAVGPNGLRTMDAAGVIDTLGPALTTPATLAPRGDGIIYLEFRSTGRLGYYDASDAFHDLLDEAGAAPFTLGASRSPEEMIYDPIGNAIIAFDGTGSALAQCPDPEKSCAFRIPLTPDGARVSGPLVSTQVEISPSGETVEGTSYGPGGGIFWVVDTNSNNREPRMQLFDPVTVTTSTYASNGPYSGAATTNAGVYDHARGQAVILDTLRDSLRAFNQGEVGAGIFFGGELSSSGSGETARLIEIWSSPLMTSVTPGLDPARLVTAVSSSPNPFRGSTELRLELATAEDITVSVHDASGRRVRNLARGAWTAGVHVLSWDGRDAGGNQCAPGIYFARITSGRSIMVKKLVLDR